MASIYEITTTFISCAEEAKEQLHDIPLSEESVQTLIEEVNLEVKKAEDYND